MLPKNHGQNLCILLDFDLVLKFSHADVGRRAEFYCQQMPSSERFVLENTASALFF